MQVGRRPISADIEDIEDIDDLIEKISETVHEECEFTEWVECHEKLDVVLPVFVTADGEPGGVEVTVKYSICTKGVQGSGKIKKVKTIFLSQEVIQKKVFRIAGEGDSENGKSGDLVLKIICR